MQFAIGADELISVIQSMINEINFYLILLHKQIIITLAIHWSSLTAATEVLNGTVVGISDGDSITVLDNSSKEHKVRLMAIDAPEKSQAFGNEAKQTLSNYIYKKEISVEFKKLDKYKRIVGKVTLGDQDICLQMIRDGMAWHYTEYEKEQTKADRELYRETEASARKMKIGLWIDAQPIEPSKFRKQLK